jgi:hypothetical protein
MIKFYVLLTILIFFEPIRSQNIATIEVEIKGLGRSYSGCGVIVYTSCLIARVIENGHKSIYGDTIEVYLKCPEIVNSLPLNVKQLYSIDIVPYDSLDHEAIFDCYPSNPNLKKFEIIRIKVLQE